MGRTYISDDRGRGTTTKTGKGKSTARKPNGKSGSPAAKPKKTKNY